MVPCPVGQRTRLIANKGITKAYNRNVQYLCNTFHSALPGGSPNAESHNFTILDGIWDKNRKIYYALDALWWQGQQLTNFRADVRLEWLDRKIIETTDLRKYESEINAHAILPLPSIRCHYNSSTALSTMLRADFAPPLDGILFYHRKAQYNFGISPLVTWTTISNYPRIYCNNAFI